MGNKIIEGSLSNKLKKLEKYTKNFKHIAHFTYFAKNEDKIEIAACKIPFPRDEDLKDFEKNYKSVLELIQ